MFSDISEKAAAADFNLRELGLDAKARRRRRRRRRQYVFPNV
jgi:hypothetical protein